MENQRHLFDLSDDWTYINGAYMSAQLNSVSLAGMEALLKKSKPQQINVGHFFDPVSQLKQAFAKLVNAEEHERIALIPSASYGLEIAAKNVSIKAGQKIILMKDQFPSNVYPWIALAERSGGVIEFVGPTDENDRSPSWNRAILAAIDENTAVVAMGHVHWADGTLFDLMAIRAATSAVGAALVIDGTQSVGAMPFDVSKIQPDALVCAGYKWLMGPYGLGVAYFGAYFDGGEPLEHNWINRDKSNDYRYLVDYQPTYRPLAWKYNMGGQSSFVYVAMLHQAIQQLLDWTPKNIQAYCEKWATHLETLLTGSPFYMEPATSRGHHLFSIRRNDGGDVGDLAQALQAHRVHVSLRGDAIRVSPHVYNTLEDADRLNEVLRGGIV